MKRLTLALVFSLAVAAVLRLPSVFEPYSYADEGIYLVLGQGFRRGLVFYRDLHDNKPPLLYITAGLAQTLTSLRLALWAWNGANIWLVWLLARRMFNQRFWPVLAATLSFGILSGLTLLEGNIANGEIFMIMPLTAAAYLVWRGRFLAAGLAASIAFLYKVPAAFDLFGIALFLLWKRVPFKRLAALAAGFLGVNLAVLVYYYQAGAGERYLTSALLQNLPYLTSWGNSGGAGFWQTGLVQRLGLALLVSAGIFYFRAKLHQVTAFLGLWFIYSLYGVLLSERPYPHYWVEILPVLSLMIGWAAAKKSEAKKLLAAGLVLVAAGWIYWQFWHYPVRAYYLNFINWAIGRQDKTSFQRYWGEEVLVDQEVAGYIRSVTRPEDKIYVWGTAPGIYYLSGRLPAGRYTVAYHVADFNGFDETMAAIKNDRPKVIVKLQSESIAFPALDDYLSQNYQLEKTTGGRQVYLRLIE